MMNRNTSKPIAMPPTGTPSSDTASSEMESGEAKPMETQPASAGWRNTALPMGSQPSKKSKAVRVSTMPPAEAEGTRQSSLKKQRGQMAAVRKKRNRAPAAPPASK